MDNIGFDLKSEVVGYFPYNRRHSYPEPKIQKCIPEELELQTFSAFMFNETKSVENSVLKEETLLYDVEEVPPFYLCILLGFQHYLEMLCTAVAIPFILNPALCMEEDDPNRANITSTLVFMSGLITILQCTFGARLPIIQGGSYSYLVPCLAILNLPQWQCPSLAEINGMEEEDKNELWQVRMREIQGAIICAAMFQIVFAATGLIGFLSKFITPLTVAPAITMIGISLFQVVTKEMLKNPPVTISMILLLIFISQHLKNIQIPTSCGSAANIRNKDPRRAGFPIFQVFPVIIALLIVWGICTILTVTNVFSEDNAARSDSKLNILKGSPWFRIPTPLQANFGGPVQWGWPTVSIGAVFGVLCGVLTSTIESVGDYYACATITKRPSPPAHALNRGIFVEGMGCLLSGIMGSGNASTSYSNNIGTLTMTKVASRRVIQVAGLLMILFSLIGKVGAIFIGIPDPILAGMFWYICPLITAVGIGTLSEICLKSARNIFIFSFSVFNGLTVSFFAQTNPDVIQTGNVDFDVLVQVLLSTGMFISGITGFILDNTITGTDQERGLLERKAAKAASLILRDTTYDFPVGMQLFQKYNFLKWVPISPTYEKSIFAAFKKRTDNKIPASIKI